MDPRVLEVMLPVFRDDFGNAASHNHRYGWRAEALVEVAREQVAAAIGARDPREIVFTSGATEADNLAILGALRASPGPADRVVTLATEHPAVLETCRAAAAQGFRAEELPVDGEGRVDPAALAARCDARTVLVSVMAANNEIGAIAPLSEIGRVCAERDVLFHSDAAQAVGKIPLDVEALGIDLLSISAHKLYGPKGVGALYVRRRRRRGQRLRLRPLLTGGGHERGLRPGTLPVPLIVGFGEACVIATSEREQEARRLVGLRDRLWAALCAALPGVRLNGPEKDRLPGNLNVSFDGVEADALIPRLEDLALASGSACSSADPEPSHVLRALGLSEDRVRGAIRIGLGRHTTPEEVDRAAGSLARQVQRLRSEADVATGTGPR